MLSEPSAAPAAQPRSPSSFPPRVTHLEAQLDTVSRGAEWDYAGTGAAPSISRRELRRWMGTYVRHAPPSLCLREINRMIAMRELWRDRPPRRAILDVGCGVGFWWSELDPGCEVFGVDISSAEVERARARITAEVCDVSRKRPFPGRQFSEIVGNCSLEHVRDIDSALSNLRAAAPAMLASCSSCLPEIGLTRG